MATPPPSGGALPRARERRVRDDATAKRINKYNTIGQVLPHRRLVVTTAAAARRCCGVRGPAPSAVDPSRPPTPVPLRRRRLHRVTHSAHRLIHPPAHRDRSARACTVTVATPIPSYTSIFFPAAAAATRRSPLPPTTTTTTTPHATADRAMSLSTRPTSLLAAPNRRQIIRKLRRRNWRAPRSIFPRDFRSPPNVFSDHSFYSDPDHFRFRRYERRMLLAPLSVDPRNNRVTQLLRPEYTEMGTGFRR